MVKYLIANYTNGVYIEGGEKDHRLTYGDGSIVLDGLKEFIKMVNKESEQIDKKDQLIMKLLSFVLMVDDEDSTWENSAAVLKALVQWEYPHLYDKVKEDYTGDYTGD